MKLSNQFSEGRSLWNRIENQYEKNDFAEESKNLSDTNLKTILLNY